MGSTRSPTSRRSRSGSAESNRSGQSNGSRESNRSRSVSRSRSRSRSKSGSRASNRSRSGSADSGNSNRSRSRSGQSVRSGSKTPSHRSRSRSHSSRSRSRSAASNRSAQSNGRVGSNKSRSRSRSDSHASNRSASVESGKSNRSRSKSVQSNKSAESVRSGSKSPPQRSRSRSPSNSLKLDDSVEKERQEKGSDSENGDKANADAADLFGDADDISSDEEKAKEASTEKEDKSDNDDDFPQAMDQDDERERMSGDERDDKDDAEKEAEIEPIPETRIDVKIPKISCDLGKEIHFVKLPNFLSVETRPFDPETYEDEIDEEETLDEEGRARLKLKVENTIRWREEVNKEGDVEKHSNARLVRWSDGSLSLHLGSEIFDVYKQPLQGDHNHLFIRQGTGLQGQAVFRTKLSFRPHSTESFTHRKMTLSLADRSQKTSGIKILSQVGIDPDQDRKTLLKKEEEKLRQTFRLSKPRKRGDGGSRLHVGQAYREEDGSEDEGAISLNAIKNKYKSGANVQSKGGAIYSSDEEGSDFEARRKNKLDKPKALKDSESSDESD